MGNGKPMSRREAELTILGKGEVRRRKAEELIEVSTANGAHDLNAKRRRNEVAEQQENYNRRVSAQAKWLDVSDQMEYERRRRLMPQMSVEEMEYYSQPRKET
jgi:hypothetical protein